MANKESDYSLDFLIKKFGEHAIEFVEQEKERFKRQQFVYIHNFNLCLALKTICEELKELKDKDGIS